MSAPSLPDPLKTFDSLKPEGEKASADTSRPPHHPTPSPNAGVSPDAPPEGSSSLAALTLAPGQRPLPEYELVCFLGKGGFGEVWKAVAPGGFEVALKFVRLGEHAGQVEARSLELMKKIRYPHVLSQFGAWERGGYLIIAMELGDCTLLDRWKQAKGQGQTGIPPMELLEYMREAAKGIDFLNDQRHATPDGGVAGIQHKDIKPQNLLLVGGSVKVADFGLAKILEGTVATASSTMTPAYAAPEFFKSEATRWSDQYSLAVTYCFLRGGRLPFQGNIAQIMWGHLSEPPDLSMLPTSERATVGRALAKEPQQRWPSCMPFADALADSVKQEAATSRPGSRSPKPAQDWVAKEAVPIEKKEAVAIPVALSPKHRAPDLTPVSPQSFWSSQRNQIASLWNRTKRDWRHLWIRIAKNDPILRAIGPGILRLPLVIGLIYALAGCLIGLLLEVLAVLVGLVTGSTHDEFPMLMRWMSDRDYYESFWYAVTHSLPLLGTVAGCISGIITGSVARVLAKNLSRVLHPVILTPIVTVLAVVLIGTPAWMTFAGRDWWRGVAWCALFAVIVAVPAGAIGGATAKPKVGAIAGTIAASGVVVFMMIAGASFKEMLIFAILAATTGGVAGAVAGAVARRRCEIPAPGIEN